MSVACYYYVIKTYLIYIHRYACHATYLYIQTREKVIENWWRSTNHV